MTSRKLTEQEQARVHRLLGLSPEFDRELTEAEKAEIDEILGRDMVIQSRWASTDRKLMTRRALVYKVQRNPSILKQIRAAQDAALAKYESRVPVEATA